MVNENNGLQGKSARKATLIAMIGFVVVIVLLVLWVFLPDSSVEPVTTDLPQEVLPEPVPEPEPEPEPEPVPPEPVEQAPAPVEQEPPPEPLPELGESDAALLEDVAELSSSNDLKQVLVEDDIIRKSARAVSALEDGAVVHKYRPIVGPRESFTAEPVGQPAEGELQEYVMTEETFERYNEYVEMLVHLDSNNLATLYNRYYPLLEQAFGEQGIDKGSFREVTLDAIDVLLAAPVIEEKILLVRPSVMYKFADPQLEALPAAHKLMLRIGPENARKVKNVLRHLRAELES